MRHHALLLVLSLAAIVPSDARAHCDTYDGPVVKAGLEALDSGNLDLALMWIKPEAEPELRAAFKQAVTVRELGIEARALADRYFLETLVRLHRAGEGEPYTGIKPKGTDLGPVIPAADAALKSGSSRALTKLLTESVTAGLRHRFERVLATRKFKPHDVAGGREHVEAYVVFMHYVERVYAEATATAPAHGGHGVDHH